jgi:hypothetical protein
LQVERQPKMDRSGLSSDEVRFVFRHSVFHRFGFCPAHCRAVQQSTIHTGSAELYEFEEFEAAGLLVYEVAKEA